MIEAIIFDNDGTLYRVKSSFQKAVHTKFCEVISQKLNVNLAEAGRIQAYLHNKYGSTGAGVVKEFGWDYNSFVKETYLAVPIEKYVGRNQHLIEMLKKMPQKKIVVTNNPSRFAKKILNRLGVARYFEKIFGEEHFDFRMKPKIMPYRLALKYLSNSDPRNIMMIEDSSNNLKTARKLGMRAYHINQAGDLSRLKYGT
jgi:putative hydrolase of the HAD superfamily